MYSVINTIMYAQFGIRCHLKHSLLYPISPIIHLKNISYSENELLCYSLLIMIAFSIVIYST